VVDGAGEGARSGEAFSGDDRVVWEWEFVFAEQYAGAVPWAAVSGDDDSRQCGSGTSPVDGRFEGDAPEGGDWVFDGGAAGVSVGGELSGVYGSRGCDFGDGEDVWAWDRAAGGGDRGDTADEQFKGGDYTEEPQAGISAFGMVWAAWLYSAQWWRDELWRTNAKPGTTFNDVVERFRTRFIPGADANNLILQMRTWEKHDVGTTPGFGGDEKKALGSIKVPFLYMPSMTDQYFPVGDARYEAQFMHTVSLLPIPSLWGHPAGAAADPADAKFLNENIAKFLAGQPVAAENVVPAN